MRQEHYYRCSISEHPPVDDLMQMLLAAHAGDRLRGRDAELQLRVIAAACYRISMTTLPLARPVST
jgi:hypothetical protein